MVVGKHLILFSFFSLVPTSVDYDTPELGDFSSSQGGDVEATLGRLVGAALSSINTYLPDDIYYDGRSDDGALLREWLSDPTNKRALARRAHFDIAPGNVGGNGLPDDDRRGFGDIAAEERQIGKWTAYLTNPATTSAMVNMALDDTFTYYPDDFVVGDISDEYRVLTSLKDYLTDPSSARALISSALDGISCALPDDSPFSQENDAATVLRKWLDADPDNARRALVGFAASMDDKLGLLSDDMAAHAAIPGYESVDEVLRRYRNDPTTFRGPNSKASRAFAGDRSRTVFSDDAIVGEELLQSLSSYLADPTNVQRLAGFGGGPTINADDSSYLPGYENISDLLSRYGNDPTTIRKAAAFGGAACALSDDGNIGEALKDIVGAWLSDPTNAAALQDMGVDGNGLLPDDIEYSADEAGLLWIDKFLTDSDGRLNLSQWLSTEGNLERILADDKWTYLADDDARDLGHMPAQSRWGGNDPTNPSAKRDAYASGGVETPQGFSLYYGSGANMKRVSSVGNDKFVTMYPDDKFYLPGYESPKDTLGRYSFDPTTFRAKSNANGLETPKNSLYYGRNSGGFAGAATTPTDASPLSSLAKQADGDPGATFMADDDGRGLNSMPAPGPRGGGVSSPLSAASTIADGGIDGHTLFPDCSDYGAYGDALKRSQRDGGHFYYGRQVRDDY